MNITGAYDPSAHFLESTRFWIQRVFVPILVLVGVGGNVITVMVLTRRRMRCTTNIYLTALAIADLIYLLFVLLLSFKHYPNIHEQKYELYWRFNGIIHWFCDAASNTSVWLTVSFTIERYIAVCHPMKGKLICTENRAKTIIAIIYILCIVSAASTTFEHQLNVNYTCVQMCATTSAKTRDANRNPNRDQIGNSSFCGVFLYVPYHNSTTTTSSSSSYSLELPRNLHLPQNLSSVSEKLPLVYVPCSFIRQIENHNSTNTNLKRGKTVNKNDDSADKSGYHQDWTLASTEKTQSLVLLNDNSSSSSLMVSENSTVNVTCCQKIYRIDTEATNLGKNETYTTIFYWFSAIFFALLPLVLIATFNCFLVNALYKSQNRRKRMTNSPETMSQSNENRITLVLIGVVVMFIICQTPTASFLIYEPLSSKTDPYTENIKRGLGNIFNLLLSINAACNFLLYCVLSVKYRKTFKALFCERSRLSRQDTLALSLTRSRNSQRFNPNNSTYKRDTPYCPTPRNLETQSLADAPRSKSLIVRPPEKSKSCDFNV